jgi:hypothetical protein
MAPRDGQQPTCAAALRRDGFSRRWSAPKQHLREAMSEALGPVPLVERGTRASFGLKAEFSDDL